MIHQNSMGIDELNVTPYACRTPELRVKGGDEKITRRFSYGLSRTLLIDKLLRVERENIIDDY